MEEINQHPNGIKTIFLVYPTSYINEYMCMCTYRNHLQVAFISFCK